MFPIHFLPFYTDLVQIFSNFIIFFSDMKSPTFQVLISSIFWLLQYPWSDINLNSHMPSLQIHLVCSLKLVRFVLTNIFDDFMIRVIINVCGEALLVL